VGRGSTLLLDRGERGIIVGVAGIDHSAWSMGLLRQQAEHPDLAEALWDLSLIRRKASGGASTSTVHRLCWGLEIEAVASRAAILRPIADALTSELAAFPNPSSRHRSSGVDPAEEARGLGSIAADEERRERLRSAAHLWELCAFAWLAVHNGDTDTGRMSSAALQRASECRSGNAATDVGTLFAAETLTRPASWEFCRTVVATDPDAAGAEQAGDRVGRSWLGRDLDATADPGNTLQLDRVGVTLWFDLYEPLALAAIMAPDAAVAGGFLEAIFRPGDIGRMTDDEDGEPGSVEYSTWASGDLTRALTQYREADLALEQIRLGSSEPLASHRVPMLEEQRRRSLGLIPNGLTPRRILQLRSVAPIAPDLPPRVDVSLACPHPSVSDVRRLVDLAATRSDPKEVARLVAAASRGFASVLVSDSTLPNWNDLHKIAQELTSRDVRVPLFAPCHRS
jgi:hypothetical protein